MQRLLPSLAAATLLISAAGLPGCGASAPEMPESPTIEISGPPGEQVYYATDRITVSEGVGTTSRGAAGSYGLRTLDDEGKFAETFSEPIDGLRVRIVALTDAPLTLTATGADGAALGQETATGKLSHATIALGDVGSEKPGEFGYSDPADDVYEAERYLEDIEAAAGDSNDEEGEGDESGNDDGGNDDGGNG